MDFERSEQRARLSNLRDQGAITETEYQAISADSARRTRLGVPIFLALIGTLVIFGYLSVRSKNAVILEIDGENIPKAFRGQWGTSDKNCDSADDVGPMIVSSKGFDHYEVSAQAELIKRIKRDTVDIRFSTTDAASDERSSFHEQWQYIPSSDTLVSTTFEDKVVSTTFQRC